MDTQIVSQLDSFEKTLDTLVESISTNNPSIAAAEQLVAADDAIAESLKQLAEHQTLYAQIQSLQAEAEDLESRIKERFQVLVDCRKELISIPAATVSTNSRQVSADEVLRMANRISKFTSPPTFRILGPKDEPTDAAPAKQTNGAIATPVGSPVDQTHGTDTQNANDSFAHLPAESRTFLEDRERFLRGGWKLHPSDDVVRSGLLMDIQLTLDRGLDPYQTNNAQSEAEARKAAEEEEALRVKEAEEARKRRENARAEGAQRQPAVQQTQVPEDSGFDLFDPEED